MKTEILKMLKETPDFLSGQQLCEGLGVSRTAVWKAIRQLEEEGYAIEAVRNRGYRLVASPDVITAPELKTVLSTVWLGSQVNCFYETDSTENWRRRVHPMELLLQQTARAQEKEEEDGPGPLLAVWESG